MQDYEEYVDDQPEAEEKTAENSHETLLEEDEISSREEAFLKGYDEALDDDEEVDDSKEEE